MSHHKTQRYGQYASLEAVIGLKRTRKINRNQDFLVLVFDSHRASYVRSPLTKNARVLGTRLPFRYRYCSRILLEY